VALRCGQSCDNTGSGTPASGPAHPGKMRMAQSGSPFLVEGRVALLGIAHRTIRVCRSHIAAIRRSRKTFPTTLNTFGNRIQVARFEKGLLQSEMAEKLQISTNLVKRWEENLEMPTTDKWAKIAYILDLISTANSNNPSAE
jgi:ribosome-binding protein aMBF1 (putative translation factor)